MNPDISSELKRIENQHGVRVLFAAESGSRAWGFASRDSDYDVRFLYSHAPEWYFSIDPRRDVIEDSSVPNLDFHGWDLRKALQLLRKSNPALLEWLKSPIVYRADPEFAVSFGRLAHEYASPERSYRHYLSMARGHYRDDIAGVKIRLKKYFYVLRPLLAAKWISEDLGAVPMDFGHMMSELVRDPHVRLHLEVLIARKRAGEELDVAQRVPILDQFIERELARLEAIHPPDEALPEAEKLNLYFRDFHLPVAA